MGGSTIASGDYSTAMGGTTRALGAYSTAMGFESSAGGDYSTAVGYRALAGGLMATSIGRFTRASGDHSTAMGNHVDTNGKTGAFVYGDASTSLVMKATADNQFSIRAVGGVRLRTAANLTTGCNIPPNGGSWNCTSSREAKDNYRDESGERVLEAIADLPITISLVDADGINMLAVQALEARTRAENQELRADVEALRADNRELRALVEELLHDRGRGR